MLQIILLSGKNAKPLCRFIKINTNIGLNNIYEVIDKGIVKRWREIGMLK